VTHALELIDVRAGYGRIEVLHGVSFAVPTGSVFALLGPNGGGKSTTLQVISGAIKPASGCVHIAGTHVNGAKPDALTRAGVSRIPEGRGIFPNLTVSDNLRMWTYSAGLSLKDVQDRAFGRFPRLAERRNQRAGTMSGGEQQMLAMARALMSRPKLICMDEPTMGLAPIFVERVLDTIATIHRQGVSVFMVEQNATLALSIADRGYVIQNGVIVLAKPAQALLHDPAVQDAYLGRREGELVG
jgi:branched-chain amino acid transport system ATP-binding protein